MEHPMIGDTGRGLKDNQVMGVPASLESKENYLTRVLQSQEEIINRLDEANEKLLRLTQRMLGDGPDLEEMKAGDSPMATGQAPRIFQLTETINDRLTNVLRGIDYLESV